MLWICINFGNNFRKSEVDMPIPVHAAAMPLTRVVRGAPVALVVTRVALCCPTNATQHVMTFSGATMHGLDSVLCRDVTCRDVTQRVEFGLNRVRRKQMKTETEHQTQTHRRAFPLQPCRSPYTEGRKLPATRCAIEIISGDGIAPPLTAMLANAKF